MSLKAAMRVLEIRARIPMEPPAIGKPGSFKRSACAAMRMHRFVSYNAFDTTLRQSSFGNLQSVDAVECSRDSARARWSNR